MKKLIIIVLLVCLHTINVSGLEFYAKNYIILNADTKQVLEGKNIHDIQSVASISKIMTAILVIENQDLATTITIDETINKAYGSAIYIKVGHTMTLQDLVYGLMLRSGNDAALALASYVGGSVENFVTMMNEKAKEIGMKNTTFSNPSGLDEEDNGNLSSVYDMALLMSYCIQNPIFQEIASTKEYKRLDQNGTWQNKNKLLFNYEHCIGGKTGYTKKAKRTLINAARKDNITLVCITFNCGDDFMFHQNLFETYFKQYNYVTLLFKGTNLIENYQFTLTKDLAFPVTENQSLKVSYQIDGNQIQLYYGDYMLGSYPYQYIEHPLIYRIKDTFKSLFYM